MISKNNFLICVIVLTTMAVPYLIFPWTKENFSNKNIFYIFVYPGCGHCENVKPEWKKLVDLVKKNKLNVDLKLVNSENSKNEKLVNFHKVEGFPTFILKKNKQKIQYEGERNALQMFQFLQNNI